LPAGLPKYIETFNLQFDQMKEALEAADSEKDREYVKGQIQELFRLIEMHVQSLRRIQKLIKEFAATEKVPSSAGSRPEQRPEMDEKSRGELTSFLKSLKISETDLQTLRNKGWEMITKGDWDGALSSLTRTVELAPDDMRSLVLLGWAYSGKEMYEKAEEIHARVLERVPDHPMALVNLGYVSLKRCNYRDAIQFLSKVMKQDSDSTALIYAHYYMGLVYMERKMLEDSIGFLKKTLEMAPNLLEAYYHLGLVYERLGDSAEAVKIWQEAVDRDPNDKWAKMAENELESAGSPGPELEKSERGEFHLDKEYNGK
jgi:tetratricopeptide (TPR) repeat protein